MINPFCQHLLQNRFSCDDLTQDATILVNLICWQWLYIIGRTVLHHCRVFPFCRWFEYFSSAGISGGEGGVSTCGETWGGGSMSIFGWFPVAGRSELCGRLQGTVCTNCTICTKLFAQIARSNILLFARTLFTADHRVECTSVHRRV